MVVPEHGGHPSSPARRALLILTVGTQLPLPPREVENIVRAIRPYGFEYLFGGWPGREIHGRAKERVISGARRFIGLEGWDADQFDLQ